MTSMCFSEIMFSTSGLSVNRHWITSRTSEGEGRSEGGREGYGEREGGREEEGRDMERGKEGGREDRKAERLISLQW